MLGAFHPRPIFANWPLELLRAPRGATLKMSQKCEKVDYFFSKKNFRLKIWSFGVENQPNFRVWRRKNAKKYFFFGFCTGPHWPGPLRGAHDLAISGWGSAKMSQKCEKIEKISEKIVFSGVKIWSFGVEIQQNFRVWRRKNAKIFFRILYWATLGEHL